MPALERAIVWGISAIVALAPVPVSAAPDAEAMVVQAEEALGQQDYAKAAELFEDAYRRLSARERTSALGEHLMLNAAEAREQAWLADDDTGQLEAASSMLRKHVAVAEVRKQKVSDEILQTQTRIDGLLDRLRRPPAAPDVPDEPSEDAVDENADVVESPRDEDPGPTSVGTGDRRRVDGVAIGLLVGGSVAVVGGATMLGIGAALPGWAQQRLDDRGGTGEQDEQFLDDADRLSVGLMAGGGALAAVGIVGLVWGTVRAVVGPRKKRAGAAVIPRSPRTHASGHFSPSSDWAMTPVVGPSFRGLAISARW